MLRLEKTGKIMFLTRKNISSYKKYILKKVFKQYRSDALESGYAKKRGHSNKFKYTLH
jgi:hypothetical protein